jgi:hypothetical protein
MRSRFPLVLLIAAGPARALQDSPPSPEIPVPTWILEAPFPVTAEEIAGHVEFLASDRMRGRGSGTAEEALAALYVASEFRKLGLAPAGANGSFEQPFSFAHVVPQGTAEAAFRMEMEESRNVLALLPGTHETLADEHLLIGAHLDGLGMREGKLHPSADDNASGVAGLLAVARAWAKGSLRPRRSILFVAFGAEEAGMFGSGMYVNSPARPLERLVAMINLDMIGRARFLDQRLLQKGKKLLEIPEGPGVGVLGGRFSPELLSIGRAACAADDLPCHAPEDFPDWIRKAVESFTAGRGDHAPFEEKRVPYLFFSTSESDDYHRPTDTLDKVDAGVIRRVAHAVWRTALAIDARDERPRFHPR